jgi:hypothetical protein
MNNEDKKLVELKQAIIRTLAFFDIFDYPLTLVEIHKWLYLEKSISKFSLFDVLQILENDNLKKYIENRDGFYFLSGRVDIIKTRLYRYQLAEKKFKIALRTVRLLKWFVPTKMISVCNNVGYNNGTEKSDIDFFIIVDKNRLWWSRLYITIITTLMGVRRHDQKFIDRICLSFYIAKDHLDISDISLNPDDVYLIFWFATLAPIYDFKTYQDFFNSNKWVLNYLPNYYPNFLNNRRRVIDNKSSLAVKAFNSLIFKKFGDIMEKIAKLIQTKKVEKYFGQKSGDLGLNVVISSSMFKLHKTDRREFYRQEWHKRLEKLNI